MCCLDDLQHKIDGAAAEVSDMRSRLEKSESDIHVLYVNFGYVC